MRRSRRRFAGAARPRTGRAGPRRGGAGDGETWREGAARLQDWFLSDVRGQRELHEHAVDGPVLREPADLADDLAAWGPGVGE